MDARPAVETDPARCGLSSCGGKYDESPSFGSFDPNPDQEGSGFFFLLRSGLFDSPIDFNSVISSKPMGLYRDLGFDIRCGS